MKRPVILLFVLVLVGLALFLLLGGKSYDWDPQSEFLHDDDQPFGCKLFDELAAATATYGYRYSASADSVLDSRERLSVLMVYNGDRSWDSRASERLDDFVRRGNKLMLVGCMDDYDLREWLDLDRISLSTLFSPQLLKKTLKGEVKSDTIVWSKGRLPVGHVLLGEGYPLQKKYTVLAKLNLHDAEEGGIWEGRYCAVAVKRKIGRGTVYLVGTPLLFTNYGASDPDILRYLSFLLSQLDDRPIVRVSARQLEWQPKEETLSPLSFMLQHRPLKWALYTLLATIVLLMLFMARRRQRVIPVVEKPVNRNLSFVRLLGTIYYRNHDNLDLLRKKYNYFCEELRRTQLIDINDANAKSDNIRFLAMCTGMEEQTISDTFSYLENLLETQGNISNGQLVTAIERIDEITQRLT